MESRLLTATWLLTAVVQFWPGAVRAQACNNGTQCADFAELMQYLQSGERQNSEYRIVQARHGQPTMKPRHMQPSGACFYYAIAPILEYLGYSRFEAGTHNTDSATPAAMDSSGTATMWVTSCPPSICRP